MKLFSRFILLAAAILLLACSPKPPKSPTLVNTIYMKQDTVVADLRLPLCPDAGPCRAADVSITSLGAAGFVIEVEGRSIMTAPSYTNPSIWRLPLGHIEADTAWIDASFPAGITGVEAILVGHAHYDHLMDVPHLMNNQLPDSVAYGSETMAAILEADGFTAELCSGGAAYARGAGVRAVALNDCIEDPVPVSSKIRLYPLTGDHAPHFLGIQFFTGHYELGELDRLPRTSWGWKTGKMLAFLVDFLNDAGDKIIFRMYYQDAASKPGLALVPDAILNQRQIDVAFINLSNFAATDDYPQGIVRNTRAELYVVSHGEDIFNDRGKPRRVVRNSDESEFFARLLYAMPAGSQYIMPMPGTRIEIQ